MDILFEEFCKWVEDIAKTRISISFHTLTAIVHQREKKLKIQLCTLQPCSTCIFCIGRLRQEASKPVK